MSRLELKKNRRKLPWYEYLFAVVGVLVSTQVRDLMSGQGVLLAFAVAFSVGCTAGYIAYVFGRWLSRRVPALKSDRVGYFDW